MINNLNAKEREEDSVSVSFTSLYCITIVRSTIPREDGQRGCMQTNKTSDIG